MNNFYLAFSVVFPLAAMMALGYLLRVLGLFEENFLRQLNRVCFQVFLPMVLFINIYQSNFQAQFSPKLVLFAVGSITAAFLLLMLLVPLFEKDGGSRAVIIQGVFRSNFVLFGIPITASLYGGENVSTTAILLAFVVPLFNLLSIFALELFSGKKKAISSVLQEVLKNPLIIGSAVAFFFVLTGLRLPLVVEHTVSDLAKVATPLALVILGGSFHFKSLGNYMRPLFFTILGKLVLMPGIFLTLAIFLGFREQSLAALVGMLASPTAVSTFTMAQSAKANEELAGQIVVLGSLFSMGTMFCLLVVLKNLQLL